MKRIPYLPQDLLRTTSSWQAYNINMACNTRKVMRLLYLLHNALDKSPSAAANKLHDPEQADLAAEFETNIEFHAAFDCIRYALKESDNRVDPNTKDYSTTTVVPTRQIPRRDELYVQSPMEKIGHIGIDYPAVGALLKQRMKTHENRLRYKQFASNTKTATSKIRSAQPIIYTGDSYTDSSPYARHYTPSQLDLWR